MTKLIGLNGRMHSGKDTAFALIGCHVDSSDVVIRRAFADPLKMSAALALGFDPQTTEDAVAICNMLKEEGDIQTRWTRKSVITGETIPASRTISGREYLQRYGTEAHRNVFGTDFWVDATLPRPGGCDLREHFFQENPDVLVITDVRFPNEAQRILDLGGEIWYLDADERLGPLPEDAHPSEHPLPFDLITIVVDNNSSLEQFDEAISLAIELYGQ